MAFDTLPPIVLSPKGREPELVQQEEERNRQAGTGTAARLDSTAPGRSQHAYASSSSLGCPDGGVSAGAVSSVSVAPAQCTAPLDDPNASNTDGSRGGASSMASSSYPRARFDRSAGCTGDVETFDRSADVEDHEVANSVSAGELPIDAPAPRAARPMSPKYVGFQVGCPSLRYRKANGEASSQSVGGKRRERGGRLRRRRRSRCS